MNDPSTRLERAIAQLGAEHEPPPGWQARVLAAIEPSKQRQRSPWAWLRRWWPGIAIPVLAAGAAILLIHVRAPGPLNLAYAIEADPKLVVRGDPARANGNVVVVRLHSRLVLTAEGGTGHRALWVYRGERELVAVCPGDARCEPGDEPRFALGVENLEHFQVLALSSEGELPRPTGNYDTDYAAAVEAHVDIKAKEFKVE